VPIRVIATAEQATLYAEELRGIEILTHLPTVADLDGLPPRSRPRIGP